MPRNPHPSVSTHRNRNRINNKTRLKIHHGNIDADALLIPDEDEEKHRLTNLVAGVDAEDANEHHLQAVLTASQRNSFSTSRAARTGEKSAQESSAYIPTPDSTGLVDNYEDIYPPNRWKDPISYLAISSTLEESWAGSLANGFTYYMDERDKEWLDKNNEEARGEGTSAQGAISASGTRTSARSAKAKGKEPDVSQPVVVSEDDFELVMGIFEKVTHEKTEFLHHSLQTGMPFPAFTEYQDTFSNPLPPSMFASFTLPSSLPPPPSLLRIAKVIYPYWRERRTERGGHRIIPNLNGDESDTLNESYICFRRREIKAVRKTRAQQVTSSDKLARLQAELNYPLELAKSLLTRETLKKECLQQAQVVWEKRLTFADLKHKFPSLGDKADEELLVDKERPVRRPDPPRTIKLRPDATLPIRQEISIRPKERQAIIRDKIEQTLLQQKNDDHHWDDAIDNSYQATPSSFGSRLFKSIAPPSPTSTSDSEDEGPSPRSVRMRIGRGGRRILDRRTARPRSMLPYAPRSVLLSTVQEEDVDMDEFNGRQQSLESQWRFDSDDLPASGPQGSDEQDRVLVDDYSTQYLRHHMTLLQEQDQQGLITDPSLLVMLPDGRQTLQFPFRLGMSPFLRRDLMRPPPPMPPHMPLPNGQGTVPLTAPGGTPISMQQQLKKMPPPGAVPQMRISSNGGMRPPTLPVALNVPPTVTPALQNSPPAAPHASPPQPIVVPQSSPVNGNATSRPAISMPHVDAMKVDPTPLAAIAGGVVSIQPLQPSETSVPQEASAPVVNGTSPTRPKPQVQHPGITPNGYHPAVNGFPVTAAGAQSFSQHASVTAQHIGLSPQQVQNLATAFKSLPGQDLAALRAQGNIQKFMHVPNGANYNLQKLSARPLQWNVAPAMQRPPSAMNGMEGVTMTGVAVNGAIAPSPGTIPVRAPSVNGTHPVMRPTNGVNGHMLAANGQIPQHVMSPRLHNTPSPMPPVTQSQSPPRLPLTPTISMASPSLQQQQPIGTSQNGY
ncbi:hypothetical protein BDN72DRAFT_503858 [Pluteus cervinus]|uniref:Uncharacterized protein n=1 Tax=Pluteus cervinus TaxID=181527 RepID=A0ACD3AZQ8_9AGAR|nr:hypothetical protein BDN72DRAFT_503858 [Pluteus cervinus]